MPEDAPAVALPPPLHAVDPGDYDSPAVRAAARRQRAERRLRTRSRWWFLPVVLGLLVGGCWGLLRLDQWVAAYLVWPQQGARFVEVMSTVETAPGPGGRLVVVIGGLNRKSGTDIAVALLPAVDGPDTRVFSLVYGSGIVESDLRAKFDALVAEVRPRVVDLYGSSMGGDVALLLAAHAHQLRVAALDDPDHGWLDSVIARAGLGGHAGVSGLSITGAARGPAGGSAAVPGDHASGTVDPPTLFGPGSPVATGRAVFDGTTRIAPDGTAWTPPDGTTSTAPHEPVPPGLALPPAVGTIYLDCTPLGPQHVRDPGRAKADALTALTETVRTDGGAVTRMVAEMLAQQQQWSTGRVPFLDVRPADVAYKFDQVMREKIGGSGVSTRLVKDQYGVIRRFDAPAVFGALPVEAHIVYLRPSDPLADPTIRVDQVSEDLQAIAAETGLSVTIVGVPGTSHASAVNDADEYRGALIRSSLGG